jgi:hypothetical protein
MKTVISLLGIIILLTLSNCKRFDDTILTVKVYSYSDSSGVQYLPVKVYKKRLKIFGSMPSYTKVVDEYKGITDANGIARIRIENYNQDKFWFDVLVNTDRCHGVGDCLFSSFTERLAPEQLNHDLEFWGTRILAPDALPKGP